MMKKEIKKIVLDTLFPIYCLGCGQENVWLCSSCLEKITLLPAQVCPYCENIIMPQGICCQTCRRMFLSKKSPVPLDNLLVAGSYQDKLLSRIIHLYKYRFIQELSDPLGELLSRSFSKHDFPIPDMIIPIPLHKRRLRWRGFNQAEEIAQKISETILPGFHLEIDNTILKRTRYTPSQMKIKNYQERKDNLVNAFQIIQPQKIIQKNILIIDDVATTGSTLFECARILKKNGAQKVMGAVIARQEFKS